MKFWNIALITALACAFTVAVAFRLEPAMYGEARCYRVCLELVVQFLNESFSP
jgi:hypothetical protein